MPQTTFNKKQGVGIIGQLDDVTFWKDARSFVNSMAVVGDGTDELPFGTLVAREADGTVKRLDAQADVLAGVVVHQDDYDKPNELGSVGVKPGVAVSCLQRGRIRVMLDETVAVGDAVRYYAKAVSGKHQGAFRTTDPTGTDTVLITAGAKFVEGGTTSTGAVLEFDLLAMAFTADS